MAFAPPLRGRVQLNGRAEAFQAYDEASLAPGEVDDPLGERVDLALGFYSLERRRGSLGRPGDEA